MATHSNILAWEIPWTPEEGNGNPLQYSCLGNTTRGACQTAVHGVSKELGVTQQLASNSLRMSIPSCSVVFYSLQPHGLQLSTTLCPQHFFRQEYWNGLPFPPPGDLPNPRTEPTSLASLVLAIGFFTTGTTWETIMSECPGVNTIQVYAIRQDTRQRRTFGKISKFGKSLLACSNFLVHISNIIYRASKSEAQRKDRYHIVEKSNS